MLGRGRCRGDAGRIRDDRPGRAAAHASLAADQSSAGMADFDSPIAREAAQAVHVLNAADQEHCPAPNRIRVHHRRQPEGRRRQDDHRGQPRGRAGPARPAGAGHRPRPAGQRQHRRSASSTPVGTPSVYDVLLDGEPLAEVAHRSTEVVRTSALRPGDHRPRRRRDRAGLGGRPRVPAAAGASTPTSTRRPTASTTSSSTARRRSGLLTVNALVAARRGADPDPVRVLRARGSGPAAQQHRPGASHLNPTLDVSHHPADHVRPPYPAGRPGRAGGPQPLRRPGAAGGDPAQRAGLRGARATASR